MKCKCGKYTLAYNDPKGTLCSDCFMKLIKKVLAVPRKERT